MEPLAWTTSPWCHDFIHQFPDLVFHNRAGPLIRFPFKECYSSLLLLTNTRLVIPYFRLVCMCSWKFIYLTAFLSSLILLEFEFKTFEKLLALLVQCPGGSNEVLPGKPNPDSPWESWVSSAHPDVIPDTSLGPSLGFHGRQKGRRLEWATVLAAQWRWIFRYCLFIQIWRISQ